MAKTKGYTDAEGNRLGFTIKCPGCGHRHHFATGRWEFNGDMERPTFSPSMLERSGHYIPGQEGKRCWCTYNAEHTGDPAAFSCYICHSYVRDGRIEFLSDCTHALAGKTVDLPDIN